MNHKQISNATFILPIIAALLPLGLWARHGQIGPWMNDVATVAVIAAIPCVIGFLIVRQSGWRDLARRYPGDPTRRGGWQTCRTAIMATVPLGGPDYQRNKVRLSFILRVGTDDAALHIAAIRPFAPLLPPIRIPWAAIAWVRYFDPSGWYTPASPAGLRFQLNYDPGYAQQFIEIQVRDPETYIQLPVALLTEALGHFPPAGRGGMSGLGQQERAKP